MNYNIRTIRDALSVARGVSQELMHEALAALAELERRASEPRLWVAEPIAGDYASYVPMTADTPEKAVSNAKDCYYADFRAVALYTAPPPAPGMFTAEEMRSAWIDGRAFGGDIADSRTEKFIQDRTK